MNQPLDAFDGIFCINLDNRQDKWQQCVDQFTRLGILDKVTRFSAIKNSDGAVGCRLSHLKCIELAQQNKWKSVLILEDDVDFIEATFKSVVLAEADLINEGSSWGMCYLGSNWHYLDQPMSQFNKISPNLFQILVRGVHCTHAYAVHHTAYDTILLHAPTVRCIDDFYANHILSLGITVLHTMPIHAIQRATFSDIENRHLFYDTLVDNYNRMVSLLT